MSFYGDQNYSRFLPDNTVPMKRRTVKVTDNGHEINVIIKPESMLSRAYESKFLYYDLYEAADNTLSREDVLNRDDPKRNSDYIPRPEVSRHVTPLTDEEKLNRLNFILDCYRLLSNDELVKAITIFAPKKKNGSLYNRRHTRIACAGVVTDDSYVFEIEAYANSDTELEIHGVWVDFDKKELEQIENDFLCNYPEIMTGNIPSTVNLSKPVKKKKEPQSTVFFPEKNGKHSEIKVVIKNDAGIEMIGDTPISEFRCLKKVDESQYWINIEAPAFAKVAGKEYHEYVIDVGLSDISYLFRNIFYSLIENNFTPWDEDIYNLLNDLDEYFESTGERSPYDIRTWPKGIPEYSPKYSKEQSLVALLKYIDQICSFSDDDVKNALSQLKISKSSGKLTPNQRIVILEADFFVPNRSTSEFERIYCGTVPMLYVRSPMNHPNKNIRFD